MMNRNLLTSLVLVAARMTTAAMADDQPLKGDLANLQGRWTGVSGRDKDVTVEYVIEGDSFKLRFKSPHGEEGGMDGKVKLDETAKPHKSVDWVDQKTLKGRAFPDLRGIYDFEDADTVKVCDSGVGAARPKEFFDSTESRTGRGTIVLKRMTGNGKPK
jgi:uncharacterized protein (TIGR03067 family)